jgi:hypothetical protein
VTDAGRDAASELSDRHDAALQKADEARARMQEVAGKIADTEEYAAGVLEDVAADAPERADHLRAMAARAREFAEQERDVSEGGQPL